MDTKYSTSQFEVKLKTLCLTSILAFGLAACSGGDDSSDSQNGIGEAYKGVLTPTENYDFPDLAKNRDGSYSLKSVTNGSVPSVPLARVLTSSEVYGLPEDQQPEKVEDGDLVEVRWQMFSLRTGELVEDSKTIYTDYAATLVMGGGEGATTAVPPAVEDALLGSRVGDTIQVVFDYQMQSLPDYFVQDDAYTLVIEVLNAS